jgi:hypothetical protein
MLTDLQIHQILQALQARYAETRSELIRISPHMGPNVSKYFADIFLDARKSAKGLPAIAQSPHFVERCDQCMQVLDGFLLRIRAFDNSQTSTMDTSE